MHRVPVHLLSRISTLGELSRPLGEARAAALARAIAGNIAADVSHGRNPEKALDDWLARIANEIAASHEQHKIIEKTGARLRSLKDLLPEV